MSYKKLLEEDNSNKTAKHDNKKNHRDFLNTFYINYIRPYGITAQHYIDRLTADLGMDPMDARLDDVHRVQRRWMKELKG